MVELVGGDDGGLGWDSCVAGAYRVRRGLAAFVKFRASRTVRLKHRSPDSALGMKKRAYKERARIRASRVDAVQLQAVHERRSEPAPARVLYGEAIRGAEGRSQEARSDERAGPGPKLER